MVLSLLHRHVTKQACGLYVFAFMTQLSNTNRCLAVPRLLCPTYLRSSHSQRCVDFGMPGPPAMQISSEAGLFGHIIDALVCMARSQLLQAADPSSAGTIGDSPFGCQQLETRVMCKLGVENVVHL